MFPVIFFWLNTLKSSAKAPAVNLFWLNTLTGTKTTFYPLKAKTSNPVLFIWESRTPRPGKGVKILLLTVNIRNVWKIKFHHNA